MAAVAAALGGIALEHWQLAHDDIVVADKLQSAGFASERLGFKSHIDVYTGTYNGEAVNVARVQLPLVEEPAVKKYFEIVVNTLGKVNSPFVPKVVGSSDHGTVLSLVTSPQCAHLLGSAVQDKGIDLPLRIKLLLDVALGLQALHERGLAHNQIHFAAVQYSLTDGGVCTASLSGAGLGLTSSQTDTASIQAALQRTDGWGSPEWTATASNADVDLQAGDVFAFGVLLAHMLIGKMTPLPRAHDSRAVDIDSLSEDLPISCPIYIRKLLVDCLNPRASCRPSVAAIVSTLRPQLEKSLAGETVSRIVRRTAGKRQPDNKAGVAAATAAVAAMSGGGGGGVGVGGGSGVSGGGGPPGLVREDSADTKELLFLQGVFAAFSDESTGVEVKNRTHLMKSYKQCFLGKGAVQWLIDHNHAGSREGALALGKKLANVNGGFTHVHGDHELKDAKLFYRFRTSASAGGGDPVSPRSEPAPSPSTATTPIATVAPSVGPADGPGHHNPGHSRNRPGAMSLDSAEANQAASLAHAASIAAAGVRTSGRPAVRSSGSRNRRPSSADGGSSGGGAAVAAALGPPPPLSASAGSRRVPPTVPTRAGRGSRKSSDSADRPAIVPRTPLDGLSPRGSADDDEISPRHRSQSQPPEGRSSSIPGVDDGDDDGADPRPRASTSNSALTNAVNRRKKLARAGGAGGVTVNEETSVLASSLSADEIAEAVAVGTTPADGNASQKRMMMMRTSGKKAKNLSLSISDVDNVGVGIGDCDDSAQRAPLGGSLPARLSVIPLVAGTDAATDPSPEGSSSQRNYKAKARGRPSRPKPKHPPQAPPSLRTPDGDGGGDKHAKLKSFKGGFGGASSTHLMAAIRGVEGSIGKVTQVNVEIETLALNEEELDDDDDGAMRGALSPRGPPPSLPSLDMRKVKVIAAAVVNATDGFGFIMKTVKIGKKVTKAAFVGSDFVDFAIGSKMSTDRGQATAVGQFLLGNKIIQAEGTLTVDGKATPRGTTPVVAKCESDSFEDSARHVYQPTKKAKEALEALEKQGFESAGESLSPEKKDEIEAAIRDPDARIVMLAMKRHGQKFKRCMSSGDIVTWLIVSGFAPSRPKAVHLGERLVEAQVLFPLSNKGGKGPVFKDSTKLVFYLKETDEERKKAKETEAAQKKMKKESGAAQKKEKKKKGNQPSEWVPVYFGAGLDYIMAREKARDPAAVVPVLFQVLTEAVLAKGGATAEGIFRLSADQNELEELEALFEPDMPEASGSLSARGTPRDAKTRDTTPTRAVKVTAEDAVLDGDGGDEADSGPTPAPDTPEVPDTVSVHAPAALLKKWLRDLPLPLIPDEYYDDCLATDSDPAASLILVKERLPENNRNVVMALVKFLGVIMADDNSSMTKMSWHSLGVVFAPSLLRCSHTDPMVIMANTSKEVTFVENLLREANEGG